jgi:hypothetical protein
MKTRVLSSGAAFSVFNSFEQTSQLIDIDSNVQHTLYLGMKPQAQKWPAKRRRSKRRRRIGESNTAKELELSGSTMDDNEKTTVFLLLPLDRNAWLGDSVPTVSS